jgi:hypothetical protein
MWSRVGLEDRRIDGAGQLVDVSHDTPSGDV